MSDEKEQFTALNTPRVAMSAPMATSGIIQMDRQLSHAPQNLAVSAGMADWTYIGQRLDKCLKFVQILFNFCPMLVKIELPFARGSKRRKEVIVSWPLALCHLHCLCF